MISLRDVVTGFGNRDPLAEVWRRDLRGGGSSAEITGTLPLSFSGRGKPLTDYLISGNTIQNGTPSPEAPVDVAGCGVWDETQQSYKLPLTVNGTEYPIYLGEVPTTRRIKKRVLTGNENYGHSGSNTWLILGSQALDFRGTADGVFCSHLPVVLRTDFATNTCAWGGGQVGDLLLNIDDKNEANLKSYLAAQYSAGIPVTIWYVLAEPETGIVNEPLHKIGDYADTISFAQAGVTIPTVSGANVLDMNSTVKPSKVYINGKGIKPTNNPNFENGG